MARKIEKRHEDIYNELCFFIKNCTLTPGSLQNYTDFKRINECINLIKGSDDQLSILDFEDPFEFAKIEKELSKNEQFKKFNKKGNNQYNNAVLMYRNFLFARRFVDILKDKKQSIDESYTPTTLPLQLIYFGAPGTSKSTTIKRETEEKGKEVHRITFHPDTDYSNFVGCYKPTKPDGQDKITYEFVAQTFVKAYVSAWKQLSQQKEVFLVIEEINRGNCAQIFGDLFQLLDRKADGYSDYAIEPDSDLQTYLKKEFDGTDIPEPIKSGAKMQLPPNLFIWATMNTSDQSLFPIDSAFKRRWDWKYLPITDAGKKHHIRVKTSDGKTWDYDWWQFLESVNGRIETLTESEDKQLGYWFARPRTGKEIDMDTFVGKVVFYLWNDIFKDFGDDGNSPFMIKLDDNKDKKEKVSFRKFFDNQGDVKADIVKRFLDGLGVKGIEVTEDDIQTHAEQVEEAPNEEDPKFTQQEDAPVRASGYLRIAFEDGTIFDGANNSSDAFMNALQYFVDYGYSANDMMSLNITIGGENMINLLKLGNRSERALGEYWVQTKQPIIMKKKEIEQISKASGIGVTAEIIKQQDNANEIPKEEPDSTAVSKEIIAPHVEAPQVNNITPTSSAPEPEQTDEILF